MKDKFITTNTIFYCTKWEQSVRFYKEVLNLPVLFSTDWFVEFYLTTNSRLSIADEKRASVKSNRGKGITLSLEVEHIDVIWNQMKKEKLQPTAIIDHPWNARLFYVFDPEGHRIEIWQRPAVK